MKALRRPIPPGRSPRRIQLTRLGQLGPRHNGHRDGTQNAHSNTDERSDSGSLLASVIGYLVEVARVDAHAVKEFALSNAECGICLLYTSDAADEQCMV